MMIVTRAGHRRFVVMICLLMPFFMIFLLYQFLRIADTSAVITQFHNELTQATGSLPFSNVTPDRDRLEGPTVSGVLDMSAAPIRPQDHIFIPSFSGALVVYVDGRVAFNSTVNPGTQTANVSESVLLPGPFGFGEATEITFGLYRNDTIFVGMSQVYLGSEEAMRRAALRYDFYSSFLRAVYWGAEAFSIFVMGLLFIFRAIDRRLIPLFIIFSYFLAVQSPVTLTDYVNFSGYLPYINCLGFLVSWSLFAFYQDLSSDGQRKLQPKYLYIAIGSALGALLFNLLLPQFGRYLHLLVTFPVMVTALYATGFLSLRQVLRSGRVDSAVFAVAALTVGVSLTHDLMVRTGFLGSHVLAIGTSSFNFFLCTAFLVISRILSAKAALQDQNKIMEEALTLRTEQLVQEFKVQGKLREQNAASIETQRITRDLHDGVLTYLSMIQSLAETAPTGNSDYINGLAKNAIREIRVILEVNLLEKNSIFVTLSVLRSQVIGPLKHAGVDVQWDLLALLDQTIIDRKHALNLFRIMQEAIHNAVLRAQCTSLIVKATHDPMNNSLVIGVTNTGGYELVCAHEAGHGIGNMRRRATMIGAEFTLQPLAGGAQLELRFAASAGGTLLAVRPTRADARL
ncbi:sensor histidine kinase [Roseicyclus mahoneyensis]|uniref:histidine kinase n=1 Tax=Roseicyclus mahoneyensis TaxID=164332 RepID=A0A316GM11_9RHOB|nr:hypothetical protein [Roseicyclus mahoneyensis]PWK62045.1 signal transduction histidine kinase [Roseicyclus mahoneyensis]